MTTKTIKIRNPLTGAADHVEVWDTAEIIAFTRFLEAIGAGTECTHAIVAWVDALGRNPTGREFNEFLIAHGAQIIGINHLIENESN